MEQVDTVVKTANEKIGKSWAEISAGKQKNLIAEVVEASSHTALSKSMQLISADMTERRKRSRNIIISKLKEKLSEETERELISRTFTLLNGEVEKREILSAKRLGKYTEDKMRPVLVTLKYEEDATFAHNNGKGFNCGNGIWINQDMTRTEREALYNERVARRTAAKKDSPNEQTTTQSNTATTSNESNSATTSNESNPATNLNES